MPATSSELNVTLIIDANNSADMADSVSHEWELSERIVQELEETDLNYVDSKSSLRIGPLLACLSRPTQPFRTG